MNGNGSLARRHATINIGDLRRHIKDYNEETPIVIEMPDGRKMNVRAVSDPKSSDLPVLVILAVDDYSSVSVGM